ncbi:hypothetical protein Zmor_025736 [Zophobas morio]|uniref:Major facilitator superfamily (MFS) profile domain-containing protein n=1 Tax=Zophobas morio TaxID=2755281 RepID=A0AA38M401_9CUCU|nr:hypothetical protein Zmor_025736 [Zophobas morio]
MFKFCTYTLLTVLTANLLGTVGDTTLTWTSPILPKLYSNDSHVNPLGQPITPLEESWIGSLINIGAMIAPLPFGFLSTKLGRKICLLCIAVPAIVSFLILAFLQNLYWYYFARLLAGVTAGGACSILPAYIAEVAEDSNRGMLSVTLNVFWTFGNLIPYVLGPYLAIVPFNVILAFIPALFFVLFLIIAPESPYYLVGKNQIDKAEESLMKLRSRSRSGVGKELLSIQDSLKFVEKKGNIFDLFKTKANLKALIISVTLMAFQQLSGINAVLFYTQLIFEASGSNLPAEISSIIIGLVLLVSSLIIPFFADSLGRKVFLMISMVGTMVALVVLGTYFFYKESLPDGVKWVPVVSLVLYIVSLDIGLIPFAWTISSELFSVDVKPIGTSLVSLTCWVGSFITTKFFNDLNSTLGQAGTFWLFGGFCFLAILFTVFFVPETRGKSFAEIQEILQK